MASIQIFVFVLIIGQSVAQSCGSCNACENDCSKLGREIEKIKAKLYDIEDNIVPLSFIYMEFANQSSPQKVWPDYCWSNITEEYAGQFFRALGGGSEAWGEVQEGNSPRITRFQFESADAGTNWPFVMDVPYPGTSNHMFVSTGNGGRTDGFRVVTTGGEVRPRNSAIRIWKRVSCPCK